MPMEFFLETDKQYGNGVLLQEYNGTISLVRAGKPKQGNGTVYMKWGFPQNGKNREPVEKAIPWGVQLGNSREAVRILEYFLRQLKGDKNTDEDGKDLGHAPDGAPIPF